MIAFSEKYCFGESCFSDYLAAKKSIDDNSLNRRVWQTLVDALPPAAEGRPLRVLELGAGIGTMIERALDWGLLGSAHYTAIDARPENIALTAERLRAWSQACGFQFRRDGAGIHIERPGQQVTVILESLDVFDLLRRPGAAHSWDLLVAHAFLDLLDVQSALPALLGLLRPGGLFYFTLNFDGATLLEPPVDAEIEDQIERLYHRTMDERLTAGRRSGDSRSGRHLYTQLRAAGAHVLDAGASDWVVFPRAAASPESGLSAGYSPAERFFLHYILGFFEEALTGQPELPPERFAAWLAARHAQVDRGELLYIAHQLDYVGRVSEAEP